MNKLIFCEKANKEDDDLKLTRTSKIFSSIIQKNDITSYLTAGFFALVFFPDVEEDENGMEEQDQDESLFFLPDIMADYKFSTRKIVGYMGKWAIWKRKFAIGYKINEQFPFLIDSSKNILFVSTIKERLERLNSFGIFRIFLFEFFTKSKYQYTKSVFVYFSSILSASILANYDELVKKGEDGLIGLVVKKVKNKIITCKNNYKARIIAYSGNMKIYYEMRKLFYEQIKSYFEKTKRFYEEMKSYFEKMKFYYDKRKIYFADIKINFYNYLVRQYDYLFQSTSSLESFLTYLFQPKSLLDLFFSYLLCFYLSLVYLYSAFEYSLTFALKLFNKMITFLVFSVYGYYETKEFSRRFPKYHYVDDYVKNKIISRYEKLLIYCFNFLVRKMDNKVKQLKMRVLEVEKESKIRRLELERELTEIRTHITTEISTIPIFIRAFADAEKLEKDIKIQALELDSSVGIRFVNDISFINKRKKNLKRHYFSKLELKYIKIFKMFLRLKRKIY